MKQKVYIVLCFRLANLITKLIEYHKLMYNLINKLTNADSLLETKPRWKRNYFNLIWSLSYSLLKYKR